VNPLSGFLQIWTLSLAFCVALGVVAFARMDVPIALHFWRVGRFLHPLNTPFGATVVLSLESAVAVGLIVARVVRGHISRFGESLAMACLASICTYAINDQVFKPFFGVPTPAKVMEGATHAFHFLRGSGNSSFPSGHMMLAGAFCGVFMKLHRASVWPLSALLVLAAGLLIVGDWHFLSDVVAGTFVGVSAGMLAGEVWSVHSEVRRS